MKLKLEKLSNQQAGLLASARYDLNDDGVPRKTWHQYIPLGSIVEVDDEIGHVLMTKHRGLFREVRESELKEAKVASSTKEVSPSTTK